MIIKMKIKKFLIYFLISAIMMSVTSPAFAEGELLPEGELPPVEEQDTTGFIEGEGEKTGDIFDSIIGAEGTDDNQIQEIPEEEETKKVPALSENEALSVSLMKSLGVFDNSVDVSGLLTRAQLAHAIYVLTDMELVSTSAANTFADIDESVRYVNEISVLYDMGYISGYKGMYRPDDNVTAAEMAAVLIRVLGVEFAADMKGGWPSGYMMTAAQYGLFDNVSPSENNKLTIVDAAVMFKNLLNAELAEDSYTTSGIEGYYMTAVLDIYMVKGVITDNGLTSLDGKDSNNEIIKIGNDSYNTNGADYEKYLGKKVKLYYRELPGDEKYVLAAEADEKQKIIHINSEDLTSFADRKYTYYDGKREKTEQLTVDFNIVYNGRLVTDGTLLTDEHFTPDEGYVELIDTDSDNKYDLVIIEDYITFIVEEYNADTNVLRSQKNEVKAIDFEKADVFVKLMLGANGSNIAVDYKNIGHNGYVLSVARSLDERAVKIYLAEETITGVVGNIDAGGKTVVVDGKEYVASKHLPEYVEIGANYVLKLNHYGHIIWGERAGFINEKLAYVERVFVNSDDEKATVKLYTEDNSFFTAALSDRVIIDKVRYTSAQNSASELLNYVGTVIVFKANSNNEIVSIDTGKFNEADEQPDASLNILYENATDAGFDGNTLSFGGLYVSKYPTDVNTKVFCVKEPYEAGEIYCYTLSEFKTKYVSTSETNIGSLVLYNTDAESMVGTVALVKRKVFGKSAQDSSNSGAIVTDVKLTMNDEAEYEYVLSVKSETTQKDIRLHYDAISFNTTTGSYTQGGTNPYTIDRGDIIRWGENDEGIVEPGNVIVLYDCDSEWFNASNYWATRYRYTNRWHHLWVYDKYGSHIITANQSVSPVDKFHKGELTYDKLHTYIDYFVPYNGQPVVIWIYDTEANELREGDLGELVTYRDARLDCTKMVAKHTAGHRLCIIYK